MISVHDRVLKNDRKKQLSIILTMSMPSVSMPFANVA